MRDRVLVGALHLVLGLAPSVAFGQPDKPEASGPVASIQGAPSRNDSGEWQLPVTIDVSGLVVDGQPAVLGAYVFSIRFDPKKLELLGVEGGRTPQFREKPVFTLPGRANPAGLVKVTSEQVDQQEPTGPVQVAVVLFREKAAGGLETLDLRIENLASSMRPASASDPGRLPQPLPFRNSNTPDRQKEETRRTNP